MNFAQLTEYNVRKLFFFRKSCKNEAGRLVPEIFLFFKRALSNVKTSVHHLSFNIFW